MDYGNKEKNGMMIKGSWREEVKYEPRDKE